MKQGPARTPLHVTITGAPGRAQLALSAEELAAAAGISATRLARLARLGLVESPAPGSGTFAAATAERLRRMLRLHADLGVNLTGAAIIVDLLERLERIEAELARQRAAR
jgi:MerR family transcriptional regulator/heat shock protein HspR